MSSSSAVLLPYALSSVAVARQRIHSDLQEWGVFRTAIDDTVLVVSELLSNALRHAHPLPSGQVGVAWHRMDGHVEVAVSDGGATTEPRAAVPALSSLGGRGLGIVEFLAERWGVRHEGEITTVWAVVACPHPVNGHRADEDIPVLHE
ncbi:ATP-binding protein [Spongiactinospora sp. TRM90649]|uniref:ATP-binding protein n=1 Tax=Spongiactinospora sp. TRM90649 TaxID=3031114 RepID=UPI0023F85ADE|nr:ATP-binding protein [Spongiactinospora sp. TRM90649]MDF5752995.1 ATP-binding protein [Spongiactinospora sp. TRM90649]